jgi:hypothetical protein
MTDDRKAGIALIVGSLGGMLTMHIHPSGAVSITTSGQLEHLAAASGIAHSLGLVSVLLLFLGAYGLTRRLGAPDRIAFAALVTYGFACVAVMIAAAVSGFIVPHIMNHMLRDAPANAHQWQVVASGIFQINQGMAQIFLVGASIAIISVVCVCLSERRFEPMGSYFWMSYCSGDNCWHFLGALEAGCARNGRGHAWSGHLVHRGGSTVMWAECDMSNARKTRRKPCLEDANGRRLRMVLEKDQLAINRGYTCAVKGVGSLRVKVPPGNWFAPPGSNRSGGEGNEAVGASGVEGRIGDLASMQAVT